VGDPRVIPGDFSRPVSALSVPAPILRGMKRSSVNTETSQTKPEKVLLHMARKDGDWAGVAIRFQGGEQHTFRNLKSLVSWLARLRKRN
jgi:hypothetical protein